MRGLTRTTSSLRPSEVEKRWIVIDAQDAVVGRLASFVAMRLRGKHRPDYTPHLDSGDHVVIVNAQKVRFTGKKLKQQTYYWHTGHPGGIKEHTADKVLAGKHPDRVIRKAVERMLPKESPLARKQMTHLHVFAGPEHTHQAQQPREIDFGRLNAKNVPGERQPPPPMVGHPLGNSGRFDFSTLQTLAWNDGWDVQSGRRPSDKSGQRRWVDLNGLAAALSILRDDLDVPDAEVRTAALHRFAETFPWLNVAACLRHSKLRQALRTIPDRLLQALADNLSSPEVAKAAALAIVSCVEPRNYRGKSAADNQEQAIVDLERLLWTCEIDAFSGVVRVRPEDPNPTLIARLWDGLPFTLAGRRPRLAPSKWLRAEGEMEVELDGAKPVAVAATPHEKLSEGQRSEVRVTLAAGDCQDNESIIMYLKYGGRVFDRYVFESDSLFGSAAA